MQITILGAGSWATAIARLLSDKYEILLYSRNKEVNDAINNEHINKKYFPDLELSENIKATDSIEKASENKYIINAIPTQATREVLNNFKDHLSNEKVFINLSKGLELNTHKRISQIVKEISDINYAVLSGPSHAEEVIIAMPTTVVCASEDESIAKDVQNIFMRDTFRVYTSTDVIGVELGGAVKNILALGIGILDGLGYGDNPKAALITRGIHEMSKFAKSQNADIKTINGLAGVGDLIVTATSEHSRNFKAGRLIGKGINVEEAKKEIKMVVEGIPTTKAIYSLSKDISEQMPITTEIYNVLFNNQDPKDCAINLMTRDKKSEYE
ncbi:MAG: NAD(P)H-dependent glycerol-3-phosphate dehydrogenase [Tissierellia bacterium]|nr:NAD(P)H-dependent glycerol-3-phosphate dehydrogenase [Tissierellia bacterium]